MTDNPDEPIRSLDDLEVNRLYTVEGPQEWLYPRQALLGPARYVGPGQAWWEGGAATRLGVFRGFSLPVVDDAEAGEHDFFLMQVGTVLGLIPESAMQSGEVTVRLFKGDPR